MDAGLFAKAKVIHEAIGRIRYTLSNFDEFTLEQLIDYYLTDEEKNRIEEERRKLREDIKNRLEEKLSELKKEFEKL